MDQSSQSKVQVVGSSEFGETRVYCKWCKKDLLIDSLYGANSHLKNGDHQRFQENSTFNVVLADIETNIKKMKMLEYDFCGLLIKLNLLFNSTETSLDFMQKYCFRLLDYLSIT